eukprot:15471665-Alexandrium_andersonii.AAC.1
MGALRGPPLRNGDDDTFARTTPTSRGKVLFLESGGLQDDSALAVRDVTLCHQEDGREVHPRWLTTAHSLPHPSHGGV